MSTCRYCDKPVEAGDGAKTAAAWSLRENPLFSLYPCHEACKGPGEALEAYLCQTIDRDCNDCVFFKRGKLIAKGVFEGHCLKFDRPTKAFPGQATGHPCFVHRKEEVFNELGYKDGIKL